MTQLLPHERHWLVEQLGEGDAENQQAADDMAAAIASGNQWHDNAQYDEVIERMKLIDNRYGPLLMALRDREVAPYPTPTHESVAIGSLIRLRDPYETFSGLIVGMATLGDDKYRAFYDADDAETFEIIGIESPLAKASVGHVAGDSVEWEVNGQTLSAELVSVDNGWLIERIGSLATDASTQPDATGH